ncbi:MAG: hypothetical protein OXC19_04415, partial [Bryobacterales bacterium]|nr:hypothetical protein [Bryobacterales bacterium]
MAGAERFVFGRWNDEGGRRRIVTASTESTWFEANYIVQRKLLACAEPPDAGSVTIRPASQDSFHVQGQRVEMRTTPSGSRNFLQWNGLGLWRDADRRNRGSTRGDSSNPATGSTRTATPMTSDRSRIREIAATYTARPTFLVDSNIEGIKILAAGEQRRLPWAFPADEYPDGIWVEAPQTVPEDADWEDIRYRFEGWSNGGTRAQRIMVPASDGRVSLDLTREYRLRVLSYAQSDDTAIDISPPSEDGFYAEGTQVQVMANPGPGRNFAGWAGEVSGSERAQMVVMDAAKWMKAFFTSSEPLQPGERKSVRLRASSRFQLYASSSGYSILVPSDAAELTVRFESSSGSAVDLYVRRGDLVRQEEGEHDGTPRIRADFKSTSPGATETITIDRNSIPRLTNDVYFIGLAVAPTQVPIDGTLSVEVRRSGIAKAQPEALTFVASEGADPGAQAVQLAHQTTGTIRYRIVSDASWLAAHPQEWSSSGQGVQTISIAANTAGVAHDTHRASLTVLRASTGQGETAWTETGVEIPVALAVVPSSGSATWGLRANTVAISSRPQEGDTYSAGEEIRVDISFSDPVEVAGTPALNLGVGNRMRQVAWSGDGLKSVCEGGYRRIGFKYVVQGDDRDADGIGIAADGLTLNGGSIQTVDGEASVLTLGGPTVGIATNHRVDGSVALSPKVENVWFSTNPSNDVAYGAEERVRIGMRFAIPIEVSGSPRLALKVGGVTRYADFSSSSGSSIWFNYYVQPQDLDADGISIPANALALNGGSIRSKIGADAILDLGDHAIVNDEDHKVDGSVAVSPKVQSVWIYTNPSNDVAYGAEEWVQIGMRFAIPIEVSGSPRLALKVGGVTRYADFSSSSGSSIWFNYYVQPQDLDADGISIPANALALNGGSIRSEAGADAILDLGDHAIVNDVEHKVDGSVAIPPRVSRVGISGGPSNGGSYGAGGSIGVWFRFTT